MSPAQAKKKVSAEELRLIRHKKIVAVLRKRVAEVNHHKGLRTLVVYHDQIERAANIQNISFEELKKAAGVCKTKKVNVTAYNDDDGDYGSGFPRCVSLIPVR
ncbi:hypothetical protein HYT05_02350 [Candidatus Kaiserbacteria bacterium]|nr:hypothetical protein [Candidatus Kaiserbacteria bacterium]